ncbi:MAG: sulfurtransferase TusA family protein [Candidatus Thorarchaeota archaeon]
MRAVIKDADLNKLDIRGEMCPMTFVYTKLALEDMKKGQYLEVLLDFPSALKNIPDSCKRQNLAEVIKIEELNKEKKEWIILLKKI